MNSDRTEETLSPMDEDIIDGVCVKCIYFLPLEDVDVCLAEPSDEDMTSDKNGVITSCKKFYLNSNNNAESNNICEP